MTIADIIKNARAFAQEDHKSMMAFKMSNGFMRSAYDHPDIYLFAECYNENAWIRLVTDDKGEIMNWRDVKNLMTEIVSLPGAEQGMCYPTASKELWQEARQNIERGDRKLWLDSKGQVINE